MFNLLAIAFLFCGLALAKPLEDNDSVKNACGYNPCRKTSAANLNVHIVPHSHDDVGWLKTVDQYYFGSRTNIQRAGVQYIIDSVVQALTDNPERKFIQVETAFFYKWWTYQSEAKRNQVRKLVANGQLEFIGGAWSMNDEAATHYHSIIDQFSFGLMFLNDTFGECGRPKIGWQIDPFGHSKEMANIFSELRYDGLFFSRLDWRDKGQRLLTRTPEMIWQSSPSLGNSSNLFTSVLFNHYSAPSGYCFDITCYDEPIIDDVRSKDYNYKKKVEGFAKFIKTQASQYPTNNIIITMGDDFNYQDALSYFTNLDKLIKGFNMWPQQFEGKNISVFYSTPSCYVKAVNEATLGKKQAMPVKTDDFFPYASDYHAYWSGYFTSRPTSKRFERQANNLLQAVKQVATQYPTFNKNSSSIFSLEEAVGIMQHHDAITGTEKQHVADDYARIVDEAISDSTEQIGEMLSKLLAKNGASINLNLKSCLLANISVCTQSLENKFLVAVYNPLSRNVNSVVRLPVDGKDFSVVGPNNISIDYQISPSISNVRLGDFHHAKYDLVFLAEQVPAMGLKLFFVTNKQIKEYGYILEEDFSEQRFYLGNNKTGFTINNQTGLLSSVKINGTETKVHQELMYYIGARGNNINFESRASGAYIFRPSVNKSQPIKFPKVTFSVFKGKLYDEVHQNFSSWAKQIIRVYKNTNYIEFDWLVGPIPISDGEPKEVISRFETAVNSSNIFYTDSNGREMVKRIRDFRATYNYSKEEPIAGNYNPVTSRISIKDSNVEICVLNDRAQGGTSLKSGQMELMIHRRLLNDDAFGVGEALNETQYEMGLVARGTHYLSVIGRGFTTSETVKDLENEKLLSTWNFVSNISKNMNIAELTKKIHFNLTTLNSTLPKNVKILTLQPHKVYNSTLVLRLEHLYDKDEHPVLSKNATVNLKNLFNKFNITSLKETTLGGNQLLKDVKHFDWILGGKLEKVDYSHGFDLGRKLEYRKVEFVQDTKNFLINLVPRQIRTFILNIEYIY